MSAHVLDDVKRKIILSDEFESILHVLLYSAVRSLQHNIVPGNVGHFLCQYFDASRSHKDGYRGGSRKLMAMQTGVIDLRTYNGMHDINNIFLKFNFRSQSSDDNEKPDENHPLNHILEVLLSWFKAYYALDMPVKSAPSSLPSSQSGITLSRDFLRMVFGADAVSPTRESASATGSNSSPTSSASLDAAQRAKDEELASKLMSHEVIIDLFLEATAGQWPHNDKGLDQKPKDFVRPKDQIPTRSAPTASEKRRLAGPHATTRPPKRSKVSVA